MSKILKILAVVVAILVVAGIVLSLGKQPEPFPDGSESAARLQPGPLGVKSFNHTFVDSSRPTQAHGSYAGDDKRTMKGTVWYPAVTDQAPFPLVVYSHGFTSTKEGGAYLAEQLASLGYVVVSVNYPLTNMGAPDQPYVKDVVNQPGDVSFLIDTLIANSSESGHELEGLVDESRIGVTGISLGGMTSTLVSFHPDMGDGRIGAALSIAGPTSFANEVFFSHRQVPFLMLAGDIDALVPYPSNAAPVPAVVPGSQLVTVAGASHTGFAGPAAALRWLSNADVIGCSMVADNINASAEEELWYEELGTVEQGINHDAENELCLMDPLPPAMNILRQHMVTSVVVSSFFQSIFAADAGNREAAQRYLQEVIAEELTEVSYQASAL